MTLKDRTTTFNHDQPLHPQVPLRSPDEVMRLERMGAFFPTRLSFMRIILRRLVRERAVVGRARWEINPEGFGHAVYSVDLGGHQDERDHFKSVGLSDRLPWLLSASLAVRPDCLWLEIPSV